LFIICCVMFYNTNAQTKYTISGYVTEKGSKENLIGVYVIAPKLNVAITTNNYGFYSLTLPQNDSLELLINYVGYKTEKLRINLTKNIVQNIELTSTQLQEVEIVAEQQKKVSENVQMSSIDIPIEQIKQIPALMGEKDVIKVIQLLPGVQKGSEGSSGIYVRGGGPDQNLILLDEAPVYNANHLFGFFSVFNGDALKSVELIKGGFPARYGGRLSSVIDLQMKDGNKEKIKGEAGIGLIASRLTLEGPIIKGKCSFLVSARRTYIDALICPFLKPESKAGYYFYDFNAKINYVINDNNRLFMSGYFGRDKFYLKSKTTDYESKANLNWGNATTTARWNHLFSNKLFSNLSLIFTRYALGIGSNDKSKTDFYSLSYSSVIRDLGFKYNFDFMPNPNHYIKFGLNSTWHYFMPQAIVTKSSYAYNNNSNVSTPIHTFENGLFIEDDWKITQQFRANIGFRLSGFNSRKSNFFFPEPRASLRYLFKNDFSIKGSYALMNQYLHLLSSTGIGLPTDLWVPATNTVKPQQSQQVALGIAKDLAKQNITISVEGYYKWMKNVLQYKEGASFLSINNFDKNNNDNDNTWENQVTSGNAWSYGTELFIQKKMGKFTGWIGYTLSWTYFKFDSLNFGKKYFPRYDRRHDISLVGMYKINDHINVSATWVYGTGNAISLPLQTYAVQENNLVNPSKNNSGGNYTPSLNYYGEKNSFRMAAYHRLDLGIQFHKKLKRCERIFELSFYNAYNRQNPFFYFTQFNPSTQSNELMQISIFPILPSFSWTYKF
jgi:outer membrane receptor for ferrienterochelin and colicin